MAEKQSSERQARRSNLQNHKHESSFPGLLPAAASPENHKLRYDEIQNNELLALQAIYGDDFIIHTEAQSAWKVSSKNPYRDPSSWSTMKLTTYI